MAGEEAETAASRTELTKIMQVYLDLHRHSAVRTALLQNSAIALRLAVAPDHCRVGALAR